MGRTVRGTNSPGTNSPHTFSITFFSFRSSVTKACKALKWVLIFVVCVVRKNSVDRQSVTLYYFRNDVHFLQSATWTECVVCVGDSEARLYLSSWSPCSRDAVLWWISVHGKPALGRGWHFCSLWRPGLRLAYPIRQEVDKRYARATKTRSFTFSSPFQVLMSYLAINQGFQVPL